MYNSQPQFGKKKRKPATPEKLIPALKGSGRREHRAQTPDEQLFIARMIHAKYKAAQRVK